MTRHEKIIGKMLIGPAIIITLLLIQWIYGK